MKTTALKILLILYSAYQIPKLPMYFKALSLVMAVRTAFASLRSFVSIDTFLQMWCGKRGVGVRVKVWEGMLTDEAVEPVLMVDYRPETKWAIVERYSKYMLERQKAGGEFLV